MLYFATPSSPATVEAMRAGLLGCIDTPRQRVRRPAGVTWCADNGAFSDRFDETSWWAFLLANVDDAAGCAFAVAPDVVGDAAATLERSLPWLSRIRGLGYPVALAAQDGLEDITPPWDEIDCLFLGGSTVWKLGEPARQLAREAKRRGLWVHMGRVNSERRWLYADAIGCDSVDGTHLVFGPDLGLPQLLAWQRHNEQERISMTTDDDHQPWPSAEEICQECGDDLACEGYWYCSDCLERLSEDERTRNDPVSD